jgi:hypothetical protein
MGAMAAAWWVFDGKKFTLERPNPLNFGNRF